VTSSGEFPPASSSVRRGDHCSFNGKSGIATKPRRSPARSAIRAVPRRDSRHRFGAAAVLDEHIARFIASELANAAKQDREEPQRRRARLILGRVGVDSRHQGFVLSTVYTMTRTPDLLPGTLDLLILRTLQKDALHGWAVSERIQQISQEVLQINQGSLYPALHRLEHQGWIEAEWKVSELGRRAKYYHLTASGRRQLAVEAREWERMANAIGRVMRLA
jgi:PadR family transcriptional regulator PadR